MKFVIVAVVVLALAVAAQGSVLRLYDGLSPISYTAIQGPALTIDQGLGSPFVYQSAPVVRVWPEPILSSGEGVYVAKTLGSEHVAPLPGHPNSALSVNLEPAPGTF